MVSTPTCCDQPMFIASSEFIHTKDWFECFECGTTKDIPASYLKKVSEEWDAKHHAAYANSESANCPPSLENDK